MQQNGAKDKNGSDGWKDIENGRCFFPFIE